MTATAPLDAATLEHAIGHLRTRIDEAQATLPPKPTGKRLTQAHMRAARVVGMYEALEALQSLLAAGSEDPIGALIGTLGPQGAQPSPEVEPQALAETPPAEPTQDPRDASAQELTEARDAADKALKADFCRAFFPKWRALFPETDPKNEPTWDEVQLDEMRRWAVCRAWWGVDRLSEVTAAHIRRGPHSADSLRSMSLESFDWLIGRAIWAAIDAPLPAEVIRGL